MDTAFTSEECAIIDALRACPESPLSELFPHDSELAVVSVADLLGMHPAAARRHLRQALQKIALAIGSDPTFLAAVADYYNVEANSTTHK